MMGALREWYEIFNRLDEAEEGLRRLRELVVSAKPPEAGAERTVWIVIPPIGSLIDSVWSTKEEADSRVIARGDVYGFTGKAATVEPWPLDSDIELKC